MNNTINRNNMNIINGIISMLSKKKNLDDIIEYLEKYRPIKNIGISNSALDFCVENNILPSDYFILLPSKIIEKYGHLFGTKIIPYYHPTNRDLAYNFITLYNKNAQESEYKKILDRQGLYLIKEDEIFDIKNIIHFVDLWLTPKDVIEKFFNITHLNKDDCLDPCASDGRWLEDRGYSIDILPMSKNVKKKDFLTLNKSDLPSNINTIVGNIPFSLLDEFVEHALSLCDDCYFLVNSDTIFQHFPNNIEHLYVFSGLEGNQKDNRTRCEFDVPGLIKAALWVCIVHITKQKQPKWNIETNISNEQKRDGFHIALSKNYFIKLDSNIIHDSRISIIPVKTSIIRKGGKKLILDGQVIDIKNFSNFN